jgi:hypothetical protein
MLLEDGAVFGCAGDGDAAAAARFEDSFVAEESADRCRTNREIRVAARAHRSSRSVDQQERTEVASGLVVGGTVNGSPTWNSRAKEGLESMVRSVRESIVSSRVRCPEAEQMA